MMKHRLFIGFTVVEIAVVLLLLVHSAATVRKHEEETIRPKQELVRVLRLSDLSLWTEARYTRHPSQADLFTPFQDFPVSLEHFPAGSIIAPGAAMPSTTLRFR